MTSLAASFPLWMLLIMLLVMVRLVITVSTPLFVLMHELGHAIPALILGKKRVCIELGEGLLVARFGLGLLQLRIRKGAWDQGRTHYDGKPESAFQAVLIIGTAPVFSAGISIAAALLWWQPLLPLHLHVLLAGSWLANTSIALRALNPWQGMTARGVVNSKEVDHASNDLRDLLRHLKGSDSS